MKRLAILISIQLLITIACSQSAPATPTLDIMASARQTMTAMPTSPLPPTQTPTETLPPTLVPTEPEAVQPSNTPVFQPVGIATLQAAGIATVQSVVQPTTSGSLEITSVTSPIARGGMGKLAAKTAPGATCNISVVHKSSRLTAAGLGPKTADSNGIVSWTWKVGTKTTPGTWRIVVTATINGQIVTKEVPFEVR
jgi:hypothetical protein